MPAKKKGTAAAKTPARLTTGQRRRVNQIRDILTSEGLVVERAVDEEGETHQLRGLWFSEDAIERMTSLIDSIDARTGRLDPSKRAKRKR